MRSAAGWSNNSGRAAADTWWRGIHSLSHRDLEMMQVFAETLTEQIDVDIERSKYGSERIERIYMPLAWRVRNSTTQPNLDTK
jgi:hypothetical protein